MIAFGATTIGGGASGAAPFNVVTVTVTDAPKASVTTTGAAARHWLVLWAEIVNRTGVWPAGMVAGETDRPGLLPGTPEVKGPLPPNTVKSPTPVPQVLLFGPVKVKVAGRAVSVAAGVGLMVKACCWLAPLPTSTTRI